MHPIFLQSSSNFYPRPPRGGRQPILCYSFAECQFLPTPSARRATGVTVVDYRGAVKFLPTPSARRATFLYRLSQRDLRISTHALREEGDLCQWGVRGSVHHFYPRPPRGGRRTSPNASKMGDYFYPRPPRGGRLVSMGCQGFCTPFLPTPSARRATHKPECVQNGGLFLPTPSARRATGLQWQPRGMMVFLPTPSARRATCTVF